MIARVVACAIIGLDGHSVFVPQPHRTPEDIPISVQTDFKEIKGQEQVKRALEVAAAGSHNV